MYKKYVAKKYNIAYKKYVYCKIFRMQKQFTRVGRPSQLHHLNLHCYWHYIEKHRLPFLIAGVRRATRSYLDRLGPPLHGMLFSTYAITSELKQHRMLLTAPTHLRLLRDETLNFSLTLWFYIRQIPLGRMCSVKCAVPLAKSSH